MDIVVCIKSVSYIYVTSGVDLAANRVVERGVARIINPYDEVAVEEALRLKDAAGKGSVTVVTVGPRRTEEVLRWSLAMGADHAVHVLDAEERAADPWTVSLLLAHVIGRYSCDLILCGKTSIDYGLGQVGAFVAEHMGRPLVTSVVHVDLDFVRKMAEVQRLLERGNREVVQCSLPAVLTVDKALNKPRYPTLPGRQRAAASPIRTFIADDLLESHEKPLLELCRVAPPRIRPQKVLSPDASLSAAGRLKFVLSGGAGEKKGASLGGNPEQIAAGILAFLVENRFYQN